MDTEPEKSVVPEKIVVPMETDSEQLFTSAPESLSPPPKPRNKTPTWKRMAGIFEVAFITVATIMPVVASLLTVAVYLAIYQFVAAKFYSLVIGATVTFIIWLLLALFYSSRVTFATADRDTYSQLENCLSRLETRLFAIRNMFPDEKVLPEVRQTSVNEAFDALQEATEKLYQQGEWGSIWVSGVGYIEVSRVVHQGEEALLMVEPIEDVISDGVLLKSDIANAKISNKDQILQSLESAISDLEGQNDNTTKKIKAREMQARTAIEMKARAAIRQARRTFNEFQDEPRQKQVDIGSQISILTFLTGLAVYVLLAFAILVGMQFSTLVAATFFYLIGTCTGLLGRLYERVKAKNVVDDARFTGKHLMTIPLLSGLAAIGGVAATQKIATLSGNFSFNLTLFNILMAAVFGLTPGLFFKVLQRQGEAIDKGNQP
jgi:hypothetical protein